MKKPLPLLQGFGQQPLRGGRLASAGFSWIVMSALLCGLLPGQVAAEPTARLLPSGDGIEIAGEDATGSYSEIIPVRQSGDVRYFSTGVGLEEREAEYPPFRLKLILVAGARAYLTGVDVTISSEDGALRIDIPADHVKGPWLFVDLPPGSYSISATSEGRTQEKKGVVVREGAVRWVHLRWP